MVEIYTALLKQKSWGKKYLFVKKGMPKNQSLKKLDQIK
tara:strand:+ start:335 stop:451 length:117 start_codon:yes stop_codon:yes gene_type:complete